MVNLRIYLPRLRESEDERIRKFFAELATDACGGPGQEYYEELGLNYDKVMGWLEKQKEQKPTNSEKPKEWSEKDEAMLKVAIAVLRRYSHDDAANWLKSLRPSWKPSEWQMRMLLAVINEPNNAGSESCHIALMSLYNDLKK